MPYFELLILILMVTALLGGYEKRAGDKINQPPDTFWKKLCRGLYTKPHTGPYRFRTFSFAATFIFFNLLAVGAGVMIPVGVSSIIDEGKTAALQAAMTNRMGRAMTLANVHTVFPQQITEKDATCYSTASSVYVEDMWKKYFRQASCAKEQDLCADDEASFVQKWEAKYNPSWYYPLYLSAVGNMVNLISATAKPVYGTLRSYALLANPFDETPEPNWGRDAEAYNEYKNYVNRCTTLQPPVWAMPGTPLLQKRGGTCRGACP